MKSITKVSPPMKFNVNVGKNECDNTLATEKIIFVVMIIIEV